jgi:hypothetical protein
LFISLTASGQLNGKIRRKTEGNADNTQMNETASPLPRRPCPACSTPLDPQRREPLVY